ncbi:MAG: carboxypeptidase-like regulatory domain-containing protein [Flavobacterium sp.]|nr:MAG: carboxypeptidase-like regulatory domain-containing protein [Flavobacterium sp.]
MKFYLQAIFLLLAIQNFAQTTAIVQDSLTKKTIPYVNIWVDNENIGATSEENGSFIISNEALNKTLILSCVGYETKAIKLSHNNQVFYLKEASVQLEEVLVQSQKKTIFNTISTFDLETSTSGFGIQLAPWIVGRYFKYDETYEKTPYLNTIKLATNSNIKGAIFKMVLYVPDENGAPADYLYNEDIIFSVPKGLKETTIDVSKHKIVFPEKGLFIAFEWLTIDKNKFKYDLKDYNSKGYKKAFRYEPTLSAYITPEYGNTWIYLNARWKKFDAISVGKDKGSFSTLAIETILSN